MDADALLATKFALPAAPPGTIERPRLLEVLDRAAERPLTLVAAPAGSGKSALAGGGVRAARPAGAVAWLSLDASDAEPLRFWRGALTALSHADARLASLAVHPR